MKGTDKKIIHEMILTIKNLSPDHDLLAILGSYGDTLYDEEVLGMLQDYNDKGSGFSGRYYVNYSMETATETRICARSGLSCTYGYSL